MAPKVRDIPFIPDHHGQLAGVGQYTHDQLESLIAGLASRIVELETNLTNARNATPLRYYVESMPPGITRVDLSTQGVSYTPGTNSLIFYGNTVKQIIGECYLEIDEITIELTDPTEGGETFEIYALPFPLSAAVIP